MIIKIYDSFYQCDATNDDCQHPGNSKWSTVLVQCMYILKKNETLYWYSVCTFLRKMKHYISTVYILKKNLHFNDQSLRSVGFGKLLQKTTIKFNFKLMFILRCFSNSVGWRGSGPSWHISPRFRSCRQLTRFLRNRRQTFTKDSTSSFLFLFTFSLVLLSVFLLCLCVVRLFLSLHCPKNNPHNKPIL